MSNELWNSEVLRIKEAESGVGASWLSIITDAGPDWDSRLKNRKYLSNRSILDKKVIKLSDLSTNIKGSIYKNSS